MFFRAGLFIVLFIVLAHATANSLGEQPKVRSKPPVIGGAEVTIEDVPYQALLELPNSKFCGGVILSASWILTSAKCLSDTESQITVRTGSATKLSGGSVHRVQTYIRHENYTVDDNFVPTHDIGLARLSTQLVFDETRRSINILKPSDNIPPGSTVTITGWGVKDEPDSDSENLRKVDLNYVSKSACNASYSALGGLRFGQICAGTSTEGVGQCSGDEGGPLTFNGVLAGVVSWNLGCGSKQFPGVSTEIAAYSEWITEKTGLKP